MRKNRTAPRKPHPDPATEMRLQRILGLQGRLARIEQQTADYRYEISRLHRHMRDLAEDWIPDEDQTSGDLHKLIDTADQRVAALQREIRELETSIDATRDEIDKRMSELDANDLAYLG